MQERLNIDELQRIQRQVETLLKHWRKLNQDYKNLQLKYNQLNHDYGQQIKASAEALREAELTWQEEKSLLITNLEQEKEEYILTYEKKEKVLREEMERVNKLNEAMVARIRGVNNE